jgi:alpha-tubulin suppressor-like RCC1 family protein
MRAWHCLIVLVFAVCASETQAASQVGGGEGYTCAMGVNGRAFCWGLNTSAQMGSGVGAPAQLTVGRPTEMAGGFVTVSNGAFHSCGLQADGLAYCWVTTPKVNSVSDPRRARACPPWCTAPLS